MHTFKIILTADADTVRKWLELTCNGELCVLKLRPTTCQRQ